MVRRRVCWRKSRSRVSSLAFSWFSRSSTVSFRVILIRFLISFCVFLRLRVNFLAARYSSFSISLFASFRNAIVIVREVILFSSFFCVCRVRFLVLKAFIGFAGGKIYVR